MLSEVGRRRCPYLYASRRTARLLEEFGRAKYQLSHGRASQRAFDAPNAGWHCLALSETNQRGGHETTLAFDWSQSPGLALRVRSRSRPGQTWNLKEGTFPVDALPRFVSGCWRTADMPLPQMDARQADAFALRRDLRQMGICRAPLWAGLSEALWMSAAGTLFLFYTRTSHGGRLKKRLRRERRGETGRLLPFMRP